ncbi:methyl-accepting chemotaxis protein [Pelagicoccus sp. SDUM812003]|uniref:methyl-accepting chemotaxis protein n=1 Tax=Pelagicoccus sp. SDUM812003 TaxID=3041267 RepID=UPI00280F467E|nr:methyl-accepting chemotaxis protein [Pelagicoccus sp. SDUM812003]MDQ8203902.1 methyl-accepting chemotaxis protein [Pelagicoccus sp. SDUM812003]
MNLLKSVKSAAKFTIPTLTMTAVAAVIGILGIRSHSESNAGLKRVYNDRVVPLKQLKTISDDYAVFVIDAANKANCGIYTAEQALADLQRAEARIDETWDAYLSTEMTEKEKRLVAETKQLFAPADRAMDRFQDFLASRSGSVKGQLDQFDGPLYAIIDPVTTKITELVDLQLAEAEREYQISFEHYQQSKHLAIWLLAVGSAAGLGLTFWVTRSTVTLISGVQRVSTELMSAAQGSSSAAQQVSSTSQEVANNTSEQAASLEETSASIQQISQMTAQNGKRAADTSVLAKQVGDVAQKGATDMKGMIDAMNEIKSSSSDISTIIKTIDEIAFQTNILALNAAVEAARAGEHGAGFSVVAEEVRNLAGRSAKAAQETAQRIESSIRSTTIGVERSQQVAESLDEILEKVHGLTDLAAEVAEATDSQTSGISQVTHAISQMEKVTQSNAASAEQCASSAEELTAQAAMVRDSVRELLTIVNIDRAASETGAARPPARNASPRPELVPAFAEESEGFMDFSRS